MIRGEVVEEKLPSGATAIVSKDFPAIPEVELMDVASRLRAILGSS